MQRSEPSGYFVAGTDTGVGKTLIACALLHSLRARGTRAIGMKPVAAGCTRTADGLRNEDIEALRLASSEALSADAINCYAFEAAIAPHLAAGRKGVEMDIGTIERRFSELAARFDAVVVEGAGGWLVPLNEQETLADLVVRLRLPVILVVGMRLGCLNHALLTAEAIEKRGLSLAGWVANQIDPQMQCFEQNVDALRTRIAAPLLTVARFQSLPDALNLALPLSADA